MKKRMMVLILGAMSVAQAQPGKSKDSWMAYMENDCQQKGRPFHQQWFSNLFDGTDSNRDGFLSPSEESPENKAAAMTAANQGRVYRPVTVAPNTFHSTMPVAPIGKKWKAVTQLTDEFDSWDSSKWLKSLWNYGEPVQMVAENSGVSAGNLWIKATLDTKADRWFKTSRVMSKARIRFPMYTECSMRTAHISAYNTFWLNNGNSEGRDEIDICENNSKPSMVDQVNRPYTMQSQYFIVVEGNTERAHGNFDSRNLSDENPLKGVKWNEAYHTLGAWWIDKNTVQFYLDGEPAGRVVSSRDFTLHQNIIWDLWTSADTWTGGLADKSELSDEKINTMYVDWVHTYELVDK